MSDVIRRYLRTDEAARYCGYSAATLETYRVRGGGPKYIKRGGCGTRGAVLYDIADLDAWMGTERRASTSDRGDAA